jgi:hypothetical protein
MPSAFKDIRTSSEANELAVRSLHSRSRKMWMIPPSRRNAPDDVTVRRPAGVRRQRVLRDLQPGQR